MVETIMTISTKNLMEMVMETIMTISIKAATATPMFDSRRDPCVQEKIFIVLQLRIGVNLFKLSWK